MTQARERLPDTIATPRLTLRAPVIGDLGELVTLANNWNVVAPTAGLPNPYLEEHGHGFIERYARRSDNRPYALIDADDRFIGIAGFYFFDARPTEIGYWLGEPFWGQGYAPEAVRALLDAARGAGISQINARVLADNPASVRVLEKCGFTVTEHTVSVVERHRGKPLLILSWSATA